MAYNLKISLKEHKHVIWALFNREITTKLGDSYFSYVWLIVEPMIFILTFYSIFAFMGRTTGNIPLLLFLLTGVVPYLFFQKSVLSCSNAISANQALLSYRQVKIIDTIIARLLLESALALAVTIIISLFIIYIGQGTLVYFPLRIIFVIIQLLALTTGISIFVAVISYYYIDLGKFLGIIFRVLFYTSGIFFSLIDLPSKAAYYMSFNPLLQIIEYIRSSFNQKNIDIYLSYGYISIFSILTLFIGFAVYYIARKNMLMNARSR